MSGSRAKSLRRQIRRRVYKTMGETLISFFNSMCGMPFGKRFKLGVRIIFARREKGDRLKI